MRLLSLFLFLFAFNVGATQLPPLPIDQCSIQAPFGFPIVKKNNITNICRKGYFISYDNQAKIPVYVSYVLTPTEAVGCLSRSKTFVVDRSLPSKSAATIKDYTNSGYDKGHMANDGDMRWDLQVEKDSFILSNTTPQLPSFNRGIWKKLEDLTRAWAIDRKHNILVYVGPVYSNLNTKIGKGVIVPHAFFKILIDTSTNEMQVFLVKHEASSADLNKFLVNLTVVQSATSIEFSVPKNVKDTGFWNVKTKSNRKEKDKVCYN